MRRSRSKCFNYGNPQPQLRIIELKPKEDRVWVKAFEYYKNQGESNVEADRHAFRDTKIEFSRLKHVDGFK